MRQMARMLTIGDKILIGALVASAMVSLALLPGNRPSGAVAVIESEGRLEQRFELSQDRDISVAGPLGETLIEIRDGRARIRQSPCPHHDCVHMGFRNRSGDIIACIPNRVIITIVQSKAGDDIDALTR